MGLKRFGHSLASAGYLKLFRMLIRPIPYRDPHAAFAVFAKDPYAVLLDGAAQDEKNNFGYIAAEPFCIIAATRNGVTVDGKPAAGDPFTVLKRELDKYGPEPFEAPVPFAGGAIGYLGYELGGWLEKLPEPRRDALDMPSITIGFYDVIAAFDLAARKAWILSSGRPDTASGARQKRAGARADALAQKLAQAPANLAAIDWVLRGNWHPELAREEVERCIKKIIEYIRAGDIFQVNFTQRFLANRPQGLDDFTLYRRLCALNPAPFAAFLRCGPGLSVASASPERFLRLRRDGFAESHPIKGTCARDANPARDAALAAELQNSAKDRAENLMIVDLMRSDLSRVCEPGSILVPRLCTLESFASVHHLTSTVAGQLKAGMGPVDLLRASFPGGSITGAPKIRAMQIIHELEPAPRGVYCGCLGWIGFDGAMDMSMTIRTLTICGQYDPRAGGRRYRCRFQSGCRI
jgi:para-aminobenzoate synthetase component 1